MTHSPDHTDAPLGFLLGRASRVMALRVERAFREEGYAIGLEHWIVLHNLCNGSFENQRALSYLLGRDKTAVTRLLGEMEEKGWVERKPDETDRRKKRIRITKKGRNFRDEVEPILARVNRQVEEELPPGRLSEGKTLLEELYQNLRDELEEDPDRCF